MPQYINGGAESGSGQPVYPSSVKSQWVVCHSNLGGTVSTAAQQANPGSVTDANVIWVRVPDNATRFMLRARCDVGTTTITASPAVKVYGAYTPTELTTASAASVAWPASTEFLRLDAATLAAAGQTLTFVNSGGTVTANANLKDSTYIYTDPMSFTGTDALGARFVGVLASTAANVSGGANTVVGCEICFLN